jgi:hypothetical protein
MILSRDQVDQVRHFVDENNVRILSLRDDVIDHLCCSVEFKIAEGKTFEDSLHEALNELAPEGLKKLEYETISLLESKNIHMKKFMYLIGLLTSIGMTMGVTFKILHWPGADELFNYSFLTFGLLFLPMAAYNSYTANVTRTTVEKLRIFFGFTSPLLIGTAILMKILHLQGGDTILLIGIAIFSFGFLPCLFYSMYARSVRMPVQE